MWQLGPQNIEKTIYSLTIIKKLVSTTKESLNYLLVSTNKLVLALLNNFFLSAKEKKNLIVHFKMISWEKLIL